MPMPAPDNAIGRALTLPHVPAQAGGDGETRSGDTDTEKGISTPIHEASMRALTFFAIQKVRTLSPSQPMVGLSALILPVM